MHTLLELEDPGTERRLRTCLEELVSGSAKFVAIMKNAAAGAGVGKTKLDKERAKLCQREMVSDVLFP